MLDKKISGANISIKCEKHSLKFTEIILKFTEKFQNVCRNEATMVEVVASTQETNLTVIGYRLKKERLPLVSESLFHFYRNRFLTKWFFT